MSNSQPNWKRILELVAALATMIASFIGGQAAAQNGYIDVFNKYPQTKGQVMANSMEGLSCLILKNKENGQI